MKTAMQELIEYANEFDFGGWEDVFIKKATELLEKEKEQIIEAYNRGIWDDEPIDGKQHYNKTYNQNK